MNGHGWMGRLALDTLCEAGLFTHFLSISLILLTLFSLLILQPSAFGYDTRALSSEDNELQRAFRLLFGGQRRPSPMLILAGLFPVLKIFTVSRSISLGRV